MRRILILIYLLLQGSVIFAQKGKRDIHKGNQLYEQQKYAEAEAWYKKSVEKSKQSIAGTFNLGDALYKQKKLDVAAQKFTEIAGSSNSKSVKAQAYHNLGNALLESKKLEESIEAYKKSLINNPKDDETRYNLAYAKEKLKEQQKNKDEKNNKDKNNQNNKDQKKNPDKNQDEKNKENQDKKDQNKDQDKKEQKDQQPQPDKLSKEDAERMLDALNNEEKNTQDKLKNKKAKAGKGKIAKDW